MARTGLICAGAGAALLLLTSCLSLNPFIDHPGVFRGTEGRTVIPVGFLYSGSDALDDWLNDSFKLRYDEMSLRDVFATHPLNSMRFRFEALPTDAPPFNLDSPGMTRRQLLFSLAEAYDLVMSIEYADRMPYAIVVRYDAHQPAKNFYEFN